MGSDSDLPIMREAIEILKGFDIETEVDIVSAHRTPDKLFEYAKNAHLNGINVIIAGAGGAAHLPGMVASLTHIPVIGVPIDSSCLKGLDALLSTAQMPGGVPVATMSIGKAGARNAGILAVQILALEDAKLHSKLVHYKQYQAKEVEIKSKKVQAAHAGKTKA